MTDETTAAQKSAPPGNTQVATNYGEFAGGGYENQTTADVMIPFLGVLQALSPELDNTSPKHIPDAKPGQLFNTVTGQLFDGEKDGVIIVPCYTRHEYGEWVPRDSGGGLVGFHAPDSKVVMDAKAGGGFNKLKTVAGNDLVDTFYIYALLLAGVDDVEPLGPIVLSFTSTKIRVYRRLMTQLRTIKGNPPIFAHRLRVLTVGEKNKKNQPYKNYRIEPAKGSIAESMIPATFEDGGPHPLLLAGKALMDAVRTGTAKAAHDTNAPADGEGGDSEEHF